MKMMQTITNRLQGCWSIVSFVLSYIRTSRKAAPPYIDCSRIRHRISNEADHPESPACIGFALSCLLGAISANIAWKNHWAE